MNRCVVSLLIMVLPVLVLALKKDPVFRDARRSGADAKIVYHVIDDDGTPVPDAKVKVLFGRNFREDGLWLNGFTDTNGIFVAQGRTCGNEIIIWLSKEGYYDSEKKASYIKMGAEHDVKEGKWQPYGDEEIVELRKIRNPIEIVRNGTFLIIPVTNVWLGVDIERMSFVKPYGDGEVVDLEIMAEWDGAPPWKSVYCCGEMRFPGRLSGGYYVDNVQESKNCYPYNADPSADYAEKTIRVVNRNGTPPDLLKTRVPFREGASLVVRSRCVFDEYGTLKSANYSRINDFSISPGRDGAMLLINSVFNPTPNDTNLEDIETARMSSGFIR